MCIVVRDTMLVVLLGIELFVLVGFQFCHYEMNLLISSI